MRYRRALLVCLGIYWLLAVAATHLPMPQVPSAPSHTDKLVHFAMYAGLAGLLLLTLTARDSVFSSQRLLRVWLVCVAYGGLDELSQIPLPSRSGDWADFATDAVGSLAGIGVVLLWRRIFPQMWRQPAESRY